MYSKYFDSQKTDKKTITDAKASKGSNCVDWGQVYYRIAKSLGYDVQFVHVKCRVSGTGHIRLRLRHRNILGETGLTVILQQLQIQLQVMSEQSGVKMGTL